MKLILNKKTATIICKTWFKTIHLQPQKIFLMHGELPERPKGHVC